MLKRRTIAMGLIAAMGISSLTGCGNTQNGNGKTDTAGTTVSAESKAESASAEDSAGVDTSEKIELRIMAQTGLDLDTLPVYQRIEEKYNVDLVWDTVESGYSEKKAVVLASNDLPDIFFAGLTEDDIVANPELFVDLTELLEYAPNVQKMFEEMPLTKYISTYGEEGILSLPRNRI